MSRFLRLEKAREPRKGDAAPLANAQRFGGAPAPVADAPIDAAAAPKAPSPVDARAPRNGPPTDAVPLADAEPEDAQPFVRCASCEADSHKSAVRCGHCGAPFDTDEQRSFNERLWAARRAEAKELDAEVARIHASRPGDQLDSEQRRALGEALAAEVREREEQRLGWMDQGPSLDPNRRRESPGLRLLRRIESPRRRLAAALGLFGLGLIMAYLFYRGGAGRALALAFFWGVVLLFGPGLRRNRRPGLWRRW